MNPSLALLESIPAFQGFLNKQPLSAYRYPYIFGAPWLFAQLTKTLKAYNKPSCPIERNSGKDAAQQPSGNIQIKGEQDGETRITYKTL